MQKLRRLDLVSMYQCQPVLGAHGISLRLEEYKRDQESKPSHMKGEAGLDPNVCSLDLWGDREGCTKMAIRTRKVEATRMRTFDAHHHHRIHWAIDIEGMADTKISLIEYPGPDLWYLSVYTPAEGTMIVPLLDAKLFALRAVKASRPHEAAVVHP